MIQITKMNISLLTWNIWFDEYQKEHRAKILLKEIAEHNPDVIALQEVTQEALNVIKNIKDYHIIGSPLTFRYDTIILSKYPVLNWSRYQLPQSNMGRNLLLGELAFPTATINVGTFHLESIFRNKQDEQVKINQLQYIEAITPINTILMGDTNLKNTTSLETNMIDIYEKIDKPKAYEFTYNGRTNKHILSNLMSRLDRIYVKENLRVERFYLMGEETQPSDHYGVFTTIKYYKSK